jgi:hypothetical protein
MALLPLFEQDIVCHKLAIPGACAFTVPRPPLHTIHSDDSIIDTCFVDFEGNTKRRMMDASWIGLK